MVNLWRWKLDLEGNNGDTAYAYAVGRIRVLETRLLGRETVERLLEARDVEETLGILRERNFGEEIQPLSFENTLEKERGSVYRIFNELCLDEAIQEWILSKHDYQNLKALLKASRSGEGTIPSLSSWGTVPPEELKNIVKEKRIRDLPTHLQRAIEKGLSQEDPLEIDLTLDHEMFRFWLERGEEIHSDFLKGLFQTILDLENIKTFFRIRWRKGEKNFLERALFFNGRNQRERFFKAFESPWEEIPSIFFATPYEKILREGGEYLEQEGSFARLEKLCDDQLIHYLRFTKLITFGIEPVIAYLYARENELKILRLIFLGKIFEVPKERIKVRLPDVY